MFGLSYLDILVLASMSPCVFVAKSEVGHWPVFGTLARLGGTLFVRRDQRSEVGKVNTELAARLATGQVVVLFPEGTSTDGSSVLPFKSALMAPATTKECQVTPAWLGYRLSDGAVEDEVCYWRDMVFLPHLLNLLTKREMRAVVAYGTPVPGERDRKRLAAELRERVVELGGPGQAAFERYALIGRTDAYVDAPALSSRFVSES